jgi:uncharacterized protein YbbC (DUF1343 family)
LIGAPWVDADALAETLAAYHLPGVYLRAAVFEPTFQKHAKTTCGGCQIHVLERRNFRDVETAVAVLVEIRRQNPVKFAWRPPPYEYEYEKLAIDILAGSSTLREQVEADVPVSEIAGGWRPELERFEKSRRPYLLY